MTRELSVLVTLIDGFKEYQHAVIFTSEGAANKWKLSSKIPVIIFTLRIRFPRFQEPKLASRTWQNLKCPDKQARNSRERLCKEKYVVKLIGQNAGQVVAQTTFDRVLFFRMPFSLANSYAHVNRGVHLYLLASGVKMFNRIQKYARTWGSSTAKILALNKVYRAAARH